MYQRGYQLGDEAKLLVLCKDSAGLPVAPDAAPLLAVYAATGAAVALQRVPVIDHATVTGLFQASVYLGSDYSEGEYRAVATWVSGSFHGSQEYAFRIDGGGDESGQVIALSSFERPHANFLVQQRASGRLYKGRNPRLA